MKHVGMIGLGIMGEPMARNLSKAGFALSLWNRTPSKAEALVAEGAHLCSSAVQLAQRVDVLVIMVSGPEDLLQIIDQIRTVSLHGKTLINASTVSPEAAIEADKRIREVGGRFLDAPVSGSKGPAIQGSLVFLVGGDKELMEECCDLFQAMGNKQVHCGSVGSGSRMKLAINLLLAGFMQGLAETLLFSEKMGLSLPDFLEVASSGAMAAPMVSLKGKSIADGDFSAHFPLRHLNKDMNLVLEEAVRCDANLPMGSKARDMIDAAVAKGLGDEDICSLYKALKN